MVLEEEDMASEKDESAEREEVVGTEGETSPVQRLMSTACKTT